MIIIIIFFFFYLKKIFNYLNKLLVPKTEVECENLYKFIKKIRSYIGDTKLLTLSSSATASKYKGHLGSYVKYVDWFNVVSLVINFVVAIINIIY